MLHVTRHTSHVTRHTSHVTHESIAQPHGTPVHMGDRSLLQHLLADDAGLAAQSPAAYAHCEGPDVTAAATPSILKHSPSPAAAARKGGAAAAQRLHGDARGQTAGRALVTRDWRGGARISQVWGVGCGV
jgi:hypothetical protein